MICSDNNLKKILDAVYFKAVADFGSLLDSVILYGSYARGEADEDSDIDVMILVDMQQEDLVKYRRDWNRFGTMLDLENDVLISFKFQVADTFYEWKDIVPFYSNVHKEGVKIVA